MYEVTCCNDCGRRCFKIGIESPVFVCPRCGLRRVYNRTTYSAKDCIATYKEYTAFKDSHKGERVRTLHYQFSRAKGLHRNTFGTLCYLGNVLSTMSNVECLDA